MRKTPCLIGWRARCFFSPSFSSQNIYWRGFVCSVGVCRAANGGHGAALAGHRTDIQYIGYIYTYIYIYIYIYIFRNCLDVSQCPIASDATWRSAWRRIQTSGSLDLWMRKTAAIACAFVWICVPCASLPICHHHHYYFTCRCLHEVCCTVFVNMSMAL